MDKIYELLDKVTEFIKKTHIVSKVLLFIILMMMMGIISDPPKSEGAIAWERLFIHLAVDASFVLLFAIIELYRNPVLHSGNSKFFAFMRKTKRSNRIFAYLGIMTFIFALSVKEVLLIKAKADTFNNIMFCIPTIFFALAILFEYFKNPVLKDLRAHYVFPEYTQDITQESLDKLKNKENLKLHDLFVQHCKIGEITIFKILNLDSFFAYRTVGRKERSTIMVRYLSKSFVTLLKNKKLTLSILMNQTDFPYSAFHWRSLEKTEAMYDDSELKELIDAAEEFIKSSDNPCKNPESLSYKVLYKLYNKEIIKIHPWFEDYDEVDGIRILKVRDLDVYLAATVQFAKKQPKEGISYFALTRYMDRSLLNILKNDELTAQELLEPLYQWSPLEERLKLLSGTLVEFYKKKEVEKQPLKKEDKYLSTTYAKWATQYSDL